MQKSRQINCAILGRVQMVMFRDFTKRNATKLGLTGYVENMPDGSVYVLAEGDAQALRAFLAKLHKGPSFARVDTIDVVWGDASGRYDSFSIKYAQ